MSCRGERTSLSRCFNSSRAGGSGDIEEKKKKELGRVEERIF